jgi:phosphonopyruvate decarboxylase
MTGQIAAADFVAALRAHGIRRATGVPCGHLDGPWQAFEAAGALVPAASEGAALAIAAGWELASQPGAVLCQNSGFGNLINPLTSLVLPYQIPVLVAMTLRGWPDPAQDEPQHAVMGMSTTKILEELNVSHVVLTLENLAEAMAAAAGARAARRPFFLLVPMRAIGKGGADASGGAVSAQSRNGTAAQDSQPGALTRPLVVTALMAALTDELLVTTTGYLSRQAHHERDRPHTFYMQGSMGHAAAIGLGLATGAPGRRTVVLDGDGAFLMHLGTGSTIGASGADALVHVVIDNGCYESTGCQPATSVAVDFRALGRALGYRTILSAHTADMLPAVLTDALKAPGPVLCALQVLPTPDQVHPRATGSLAPADISRRFTAEASAKGTRR